MDHSDRGTLEYLPQNLEYNLLQNQGRYRYACHKHVAIDGLILDRNLLGSISKTLCHKPFGHRRIQQQKPLAMAHAL